MPLLNDIFDAFGQAKVFNTLDLRSSYHLLPLKGVTKSKQHFGELILMGSIVYTNGSFCHLVRRMPFHNFKKSWIKYWWALVLPSATLMTLLFLASPMRSHASFVGSVWKI
jgi:hypothetical protein